MKKRLFLLWLTVFLFIGGNQVADAACACVYVHPHIVTNDWHPSPPDRIYTRTESLYFWDDHYNQSEYYGFGQVKTHSCGATADCPAKWTGEVFSDLSWRIGRWKIYVQDQFAVINYPVSCSGSCGDSGPERIEEYVHECEL